MALGYELTITDSKGGVIYLYTNADDNKSNIDIINASYKSNTLNNNVMTRASDVRAEINVLGLIKDSRKTETCKLAEWAKEKNPDLVYRTVKLVVHSSPSDSKILRSYELEGMFVVDYKESFDEYDKQTANDCGVFELYIVQKQGANAQYIETE